MRLDVTFPGGVKVDATYRGHTLRTDQPQPMGGDTALSPLDVFFASIATCMGFYALRFCQERNLPTEGLGLTLNTERNPETKRYETVTVTVRTPDAFPDKYRQALHRAVDLCAVKRHIVEPPEFSVEIVAPEPVPA